MQHTDKVITLVPVGDRNTAYRVDGLPVKILQMHHSSLVLKGKLRNVRLRSNGTLCCYENTTVPKVIFDCSFFTPFGTLITILYIESQIRKMKKRKIKILQSPLLRV